MGRVFEVVNQSITSQIGKVRKVDPDSKRFSARITSRSPPAQLSGGTSLDLHVAATPTTTVPRPFCRLWPFLKHGNPERKIVLWLSQYSTFTFHCFPLKLSSMAMGGH